MKRTLKSFDDLLLSEHFDYDKYEDCLIHCNSRLLKFSRYWIDRFVGQTEEQIRNQIKVIDGYELTLPQELFGVDSDD